MLLAKVSLRIPKTLAVVDSLPGLCTDYVWGDAVFSALAGGTHLAPHCSMDNLRVRCHLGLVVPGDSTLRVEREMRSWQEGKCLVFEDSFEHEVWNRSRNRRIVLIADVWHPGLTAVERRALTAGFGKSEVRRVFMNERLDMTDAPHRYAEPMEAAVERQDASELMREFWEA